MAAARGASAGRRIPGHQPRAVSAGARAVGAQRELCAWSATRISRSTDGAAPTSATSWTSSATIPSAQIFKLEQNYRSTKTILAAADAVIRNNRERKEKRLWTENDAGEPVTYFTGVTERDEADFIAREIARLTAEGGVRPADVVVFYRVNAQSRVIEEALVRRRDSLLRRRRTCAFTSSARSRICSPTCA